METEASGPERGLSLRSRAALAVALTVTFYLLAVIIALGLIVTPIALWASSGHGNLWVTVAMVGAGATILRAIVPERDRFEPPGPELSPEEQPRLRQHDPPTPMLQDRGIHREVEVDGVRRGLAHLSRDRVDQLLGLPLLATVDADELRAVIAHEYGHYAGGDTRFAGWIWRTRVAILKTVAHLVASESWFRRSVVRWPFQWYALLFLRITNAVSRRAEFAADALAARVASPEVAGRALRRVEAVSPAFDSYWQFDVAPMLESGRRPPIAAGLASMTANAELATALDDVVRSDIEAREPDPYASHPTLRQRLQALGVPVDATAPAPVADPASGLLEDLPKLEQRLLSKRFGEEVGALQPADWSDSTVVHMDRLRETCGRLGAAFPSDLTVGSSGAAAADLPARRDEIRGALPPEDRDVPDELVDGLAVSALAAMIVMAAERAGATVTAPPGETLHIRHPAGDLDPWALLGPIAAGEQEPSTWKEHPLVQALGDAPLRPASATVTTAPAR